MRGGSLPPPPIWFEPGGAQPCACKLIAVHSGLAPGPGAFLTSNCGSSYCCPCVSAASSLPMKVSLSPWLLTKPAVVHPPCQRCLPLPLLVMLHMRLHSSCACVFLSCSLLAAISLRFLVPPPPPPRSASPLCSLPPSQSLQAYRRGGTGVGGLIQAVFYWVMRDGGGGLHTRSFTG